MPSLVNTPLSLVNYMPSLVPLTGQCGTYFDRGAAEATPWGPRPNFADPEVRAWIVEQVRTLIVDFHVGAFRWDSTACMRRVGSKLGDGGCDADNAAGYELLQEANRMAQGLGGAGAGTLMVAEDTWGAPFPAMTAALNDTTVSTPAGTSGGAGFQAQWGYVFYGATTSEVTAS